MRSWRDGSGHGEMGRFYGDVGVDDCPPQSHGGPRQPIMGPFPGGRDQIGLRSLIEVAWRRLDDVHRYFNAQLSPHVFYFSDSCSCPTGNPDVSNNPVASAVCWDVGIGVDFLSSSWVWFDKVCGTTAIIHTALPFGR